MSEIIKIGEKIELDIFLEGGVTGRFVRAILKDANDIALAESPLTLTELSDGRYFNKSVVKQAGSVLAIFQTFEDAGFTTPDIDFPDTIEKFIDPPFTKEFSDPFEIEIGDTAPLEIEIGELAPLEIDIGEC